MILDEVAAPAPAVDPCVLSPVTCAAKDAAGDTVGVAADNFMTRLIDGAADGLIELLNRTAVSMFTVPSPDLGTVEGSTVTPSGTLQSVFNSTSWLVMAIAVISIMVTIMRMFWTLQASEGQNILRLLFNIVASTTVVLGMTIMLVEFSDRASPWLMMKIAGMGESEYAGLAKDEAFAKRLIGIDPGGGTQALGNLALIAILMLVLTTIGVLMQWIFLIVRSPILIIMVAFVPIFAAASGTRQGQERLRKSLMFLLAFVLYKPVVAIIYGVGLRLMKAEDQTSDPIFQFLWGSMIILMAAVALPAMVNLFVREAGEGSSSAFSGAAGLAAAGAATYGAASLAGAALATGGTGAATAAASRSGGAATPAPVGGSGGGGSTPGGFSGGTGASPSGGGSSGGSGGSGGGSGSSGAGPASPTGAAQAAAGGDSSAGGEDTASASSGGSSTAGGSSSGAASTGGAGSVPTGGGRSAGASSSSAGGDAGGPMAPPETPAPVSAQERRGATGGDSLSGDSSGSSAAPGAQSTTAAPPAPAVRQVGSRARARQARQSVQHVGSTATKVASGASRVADDMSQPAGGRERRG
ncbi:hypothetical protein [Janibacter melonis]|uniref:hypothetical protein n=1 Tax=Janibacter melonis TaxID=262209 RepID=UPI00174A46E7|nr:hypothetical protein [Janibacter melonis]